MKALSLFLAIAFSLQLQAVAAGPEKMALKFFDAKEKKYKEMSLQKKEGAMMSANCLKTCDALSALKKKAADPSREGINVVGNPAGTYCRAYNAKNIIFSDSKKREYDYCVFLDGSAIDAWDLYNRHH
jgi:putative hemolysin